MQLRHNPLQIFKNSKTPAGLYARQKWLKKSATAEWKKDYDQTVAALLSTPFPEIENGAMACKVITRLFGLHLTVRSATPQIHATLSRLLDLIHLESDQIELKIRDDGRPLELGALPFTRSHLSSLLLGTSLFLASIFGRENDPYVLTLYRWLCEKGIDQSGRWIGKAETHNVFRALVVHPEYSRTEETARVVDYIGGQQTDEGDWGPGLPFYQTLNALAHLDHHRVSSQLQRAFRLLMATQNTDGSWGRDEQEWDTFLVVHSLKNVGVL